MRNGMKKTLSIVLTIMTTAALATTVYATDYYQFPTQGTIVSPTADNGTASSSSAIKDAVASATVNDDGAIEVSVSTPNITVSSKAMKEAAAAGAETVDVTYVKNGTAKFDLAIPVGQKAAVVRVAKAYSTINKCVIVVSGNKKFDPPIMTTYKDCKMSAEKLENAKVYCDGELVDVELTFDEDGNPVFPMTKSGKWEIK